MTARGAARILAAPLALVAMVPLWFGFWLTVIAFASAWQRPDPAGLDGDPCCAYPDTWAELVGGTVTGLAFALATVGVAIIGYQLARFALAGTAPGRRGLRLAAAGFAAAFVALVVMFV